MKIKISGSGEYKPSQIINSSEFDLKFHKRANWTARNFGVSSRRFASQNETSTFMGAQAARDAITAAELNIDDIDCVVSACAVMEQPIPCLAIQIQRELGLGNSGIPAFDINATCLSFVVALDLISCAISLGRYKKVLIVSSEIASAGLNFDSAVTAGLFGDGAAAIVVEGAEVESPSTLIATHMESFGDGADLCQLRSGGTKMRPHEELDSFLAGTYFEMNGKALYRMAAEHFPTFFNSLLKKADVQIKDIACVIPHQASGKALDHIISLLGLPSERTVRILADHGNQIAASIPAALHTAIKNGMIQRGDLGLLLGSGAGMSLGGVIFRY